VSLGRLRLGEWVTLAGALGLFVTLFFDWFGVEGDGRFLEIVRVSGVLEKSGWSGVGWALAVLLAVAACRRGGGAQDRAAEPQPVTLSPENVAVVAERTLRSGPGIQGTLRARREAVLRAEVGGAVRAVVADAGQRVSSGQVLARIDEAALQDALLAARSGVAAAKNGVQVAEANARRARTLADAGALAPQQAEQAEAALEGARAQAADARARLSLAEQQIGKTRVRAPFAGVVARRQVSVGDIVAPGGELFTVIDPTRLQFEAAIPAARLGEVSPGAPVEFGVTGFEILVGFLQAYIFTLLTAVYIGDSLHPEH